LVSHYSIGQIDQDVLDLFARSASDPDQRKTLLELSENGADGMDLLDLLEKFPLVRPEPAELVATLKALRPRLYSISSSPRAHPGQVHLTVGYVSYTIGNRLRKGVASTYLADRLLPGAKGRIFIQPSHRFGPPADPKAPMIMVGPGTGIAPFRAFLEDREASGATGKNWLFFGDQRKQLDFLYETQLELYRSQGLLTRLDTAFSRDQSEKVYVQQRMLENGEELWRWLQEGAYFYDCGDAKRMAHDVDKALQQIVAKHGGMSPADAKKYVADMTAAKRYQKDVY
jgi:sulfite reductase (NADPH) flavoprotein alpha-component